MTVLILLAGFLVSMGATGLLIYLLRSVAIARGWIDQPDGDRKVHRKPIPTVGGLAIALGILAGLTVTYSARAWLPFDLPIPHSALVIGAGAMVLTGFIDDTRKLSFKQKLLVQLIVAYALIHAGYRFDLSGLSFLSGDSYLVATYSSVITMLWIVGIMNAINLLDGLDGLAAGVSVIALASFSLILLLGGQIGMVVPALVIMGALGGFLHYNSNPASIFMGDSGSLLLGVLLAVFALESQVHADPMVAVLVPIVVLGLPILDTNLSIVRRLVSKRDVFAPDRDHIHHRLLIHWSPQAAVYILYMVAAAFGAIAVFMSAVSTPAAYAMLGLTLVGVCVGVYALGYVQARPVVFEPHSLVEALIPSRDTLQQELNKSAGTSISPSAGADPRSGRHVDMSEHGRRVQSGSGDGAVSDVVPSIVTGNRMSNVYERSTIVASSSLAHADLGDESVVLDLDSGVYFGLNEVGAFIIERISNPMVVGDLLDALQKHFAVDPERLKTDTLAFLERMQEANLILVMNGTPA